MSEELTIRFILAAKNINNVFDPPEPTINCIPEWYKEQPGYMNNEKTLNDEGSFNTTVKKCMPVFDAMTAGYIFRNLCDIQFVANEASIASAHWQVNHFKVIESHAAEQFNCMRIDKTAWETNGAYKFNNPWIIRTPPGYSCLFTQAMHQHDPPLRLFSGIVDTDTHPMPINFPFLLRKGWAGLLKTGAPLIQIIPFKREVWQQDITNEWQDNTEVYFDTYNRSLRDFSEQYKTNFRQRKEWL